MTAMYPTPITEAALLKRINRKLAHKGEVVKKARGARERQDLGVYYLVDERANVLVAWHVDLPQLGRELGVLAPTETVENARPV